MPSNYDFLRTFTFDDQETSHLFQISKVNIPFMSKQNEFFSVGNTDGKHFRNTRLGDYSISIDGFVIKDNTGVDVSSALDQLKLIINSDEPKKLIFDIFPDRYFNAIFSGVQEYDATDPRYTPLTLVFDVPDGLAHQIEPNTFTNVYSTSRNLILDSEYQKKDVYLHQGVKLAEEKHNGSSIVYVDYREGIPYGGSAQDEYVWLPIQSMNRRNLPELQVGQDVNFSIDAKVLAIDEDNDRPEAGNLVLEEWSVNPSKILRTHFINIPKEVGDFKKYGKVIKITDPNTKALNVNYGITGLDTLIHWSKPMLSLLPPIGETVTAPSVGANLYSNSLDFGDYDYSGNPNLMNNLSFSDFAVQSGAGTISDGGNFLKINKTSGTNLFVMAGYKNSAYYLTPVLPNTTYAITYVLRKSSNFVSQSGKRIFLRYRLNQNDVTNNLGELILDSTNVTAEFTTYTKTFTTGALVNPNSYYFQVLVEEGLSGEIELSYEIKLERGSTATPYQPNLLDAPYYLSKIPLGENILKPASFPINTTEYMAANFTPNEPYVQGQKYTFTMKASKPSTQTFGIYLRAGSSPAGNMVPVEGLADVWQLTFEITQSHIDGSANALNVFQAPRSTKGTVNIEWAKLEKGDTRTPNIPYYKYKGFAPAPSNNPKDYHWEYEPTYYQAINYEPSTTGISDLLKVQNNGTYKTTPRFIFTTQGENGLVALAKDDGSLLQFGNPEEVDNVTNVVSQQVVSWSFYGSQLPVNMEVNAPIGSSTPYFSNNPNTPNIIQGSWNMDLDVDSALPVWIPGETKEVWHGPTLRHAIPLDSTGNRNGEFSTHNRFRFYTPNQKHRGRIEYVISDDNVENYLGFVLRDSATTNTNMVMECWYKGKLLKSIKVSRKEFTKDFFEINMYRYKKSLKWRLVQIKGITNNNTVIIDKQVVFDYNLDEEDTTPIKYWGVWTGRYQNSNYIRPFVTDTQFRWISTPVVQNIRNYFQDGDIIEIDVKSRQILVNGIINNELNVVGNQWEKFTLGSGETTIQPIVSSWANPAEVICIVEESYL
jgi:predicted phage tail component-like protein